MLIRGHFWPVFLDKTVVFIHSHTVGIGQNIQVSAVAAGMLSDIHGGGDLKHGDLILFTGINGSCELRITEHIHDTVITDPVTASEVLLLWKIADMNVNVHLKILWKNYIHMILR